MKTLHQSISDILAKLDDLQEKVWSRAEIQLYLERAYDKLCTEANILFDMKLGADTPAATLTLPDAYTRVDRATYDYRGLYPEFSRYIAEKASDYHTTTGSPERFTQDKDGFFTLRFIPVPSATPGTFSYSGTRGTIKGWTTELSGTITGTRGIVREIPEHFASGTLYGVPKRLWSDTSNIRVEYFRKRLDRQIYEIPDWMVKWVEFGAMAKALEKEGPGQDLKLSQHFGQRFLTGVARAKTLTADVLQRKLGRIGSRTNIGGQRPALARLPLNYGPSIRRY